MGSPDKKLSEIVNIVKSWIPRRSEPANVSRDFWMPDQSCRVCYECDSQFTIFNRRHHCRLCGRVFCAKCTANSIPVSSANDSRGEDWERIRVCNYCYKQWEQDLARIENGAGEPSPGLSKSPSATSLASSKSSCTCHSSNSTVGSTPYSTGPYQHVSSSSNFSTRHSPQMDPVTVQQEKLTCQKSTSRKVTMEDSLPTQLGLFMNRSDDEDDDYGVYHSDSETRHLSSANDCYNTVDIDGMDKVYRPLQMQPDGANTDEKSLSCSSLAEHYETKCMEGVKKFGNEGDKHDSSDECDTPSYDVESTKAEPVDFENNGLLWLPPDPEDEEDEREAALFYDDEEEGATGEWGYLRSSNSFGSGESRSRDKSSEEHRKAMKNVVEGHFRVLVAQLLQVENLPVHNDHVTENWLDIITSLAWEAATLLKPDMSRSGGMDPGGYVKIKCIACGRRCESTVIKGVVCKKNVAHRRMKSRIDRPRFLILGGALEYQRVSNLLSSVDTLLQQEMDHLKMAVAKIEAHHPKVLLVEKSVSRYAQEYLLAKNISLVLNVKRPLLERIARCTGAQIVSSIDHLMSPKLGYCDTFHVDKLHEEHGSAGQCGKKLTKTLMFFEGCPKPLGCTILLKGASGDELKKVKHVLQYGVFAAYHLALETSFLADEGASLPELPLKSPITVALPDKPSSIDRSISTIPGFSILAAGRSPGSQACCTLQKTNKGSVSDRGLSNSRDLILKLEGDDSTRSCIPSSCPPNSIESTASSTSLSIPPQCLSHSYHSELSPISASKITGSLGIEEIFRAVKANAGESKLDYSLNSNTFGYETGHADCNSLAVIQGSKDVTSVSQEHNHDNEVESSKEVFPPPSDHQSILVSLSTRCVWKGTVCERAHLFRIKYYGSFDKPLGRYLRDHLFDQNYLCHSCGMPSEAHVHCYTHQQGSLTISVKKLKEILLPGEKDGKIWMWHRCLRCPRTNGFPPATRRVLMSDAAWGLSLGKFLELSFSNHAAASRVATCGHSLHRDCLRFYGFGRMVACFHYAAINVLSVYLPPPKLEFYYDDQGWIQKEANEVYDQAELLFAEVKNALLQISLKLSTTMSQDAGTRTIESKQGIAELEEMLQKEKEEFEEALQKALCKEEKGGQTVYDILEINKLRRQIFFHSFVWDQRLIHAASLSNNNIRESFNSSIPKSEEKPVSSTEKVVELNLLNKPAKGFSNCDSFHLEDKPKISQQGETGPTGLSGGVQNNDQMEREQGHGIESEFRLSSSASTNDKSDPLDSEKSVCRAFSEGEYPIVADLSHTLDAAWTGESQPTSTAQKEDQYPSADSTPSGSTALINTNTIPTNLENSAIDQVNVEGTHSLGSSIPQKGLENVESAMKWVSMSFSNVNRSINKSALLSAQKLCNGEYNPIFVCVFREWEQQGGARLLLPVGVNDIVIPVYDDEPTSIIAYALVSLEYRIQMSQPEIQKDDVVTSASLPHSLNSFDEAVDTYRSMGSTDASILSLSGLHSSQVVDPLYSKDLHARVSFTDDGSLGKVKYLVTCYFAKQFEALRRKCCPSELDYVRSLSRCKKWGAQGGKSNVFFAKTLDDRFIIKQVTKTELESFIKFGPAYFRYLSESISTGSPTCLAKILGIYQVSSKHMKGGKEFKMDVLVMENLLYRRNITRVYDLKGSSRSRYNPDTSGSNKILLDQNLIESMPTSPIFVGNKAKRLLERAVWNDTLFLGSIDVMDYSLLVGMDEERHELVLGIIDFMRQYTWDKHLETWVKTSGILGGHKNSTPTVISPQQYKKRFRKAMTAYFLMVPDQWSPQTIIPSGSQSDLCEENTQGVNSPVMAGHKDVR